MDILFDEDTQKQKRQLSSLSKEELDEIKERICMNSIHYAKRQMTFFRSFSDVKWIDAEDTVKLRDLLDRFQA